MAFKSFSEVILKETTLSAADKKVARTPKVHADTSDYKGKKKIKKPRKTAYTY